MNRISTKHKALNRSKKAETERKNKCEKNAAGKRHRHTSCSEPLNQNHICWLLHIAFNWAYVVGRWLNVLVENRTILFRFFHRKYCLFAHMFVDRKIRHTIARANWMRVCARECVNSYVCWQLADVGSVWKKFVQRYVLRTRVSERTSECATDSRNTITWATSENSPNDLDNKFTSKWHIFHVPTDSIIRLYSLSSGGNWNFYGQQQPVTANRAMKLCANKQKWSARHSLTQRKNEHYYVMFGGQKVALSIS